MDTTTIQLKKQTKEKISSFGLKGETYDDIIKRMIELASKHKREN